MRTLRLHLKSLACRVNARIAQFFRDVRAHPVPRAAVVALVSATALVAVSWGLAGVRSPQPSAVVEDYFGDSVSRTGASTDRLVESLQARLRATPDDWQAYSQLGVAYLQKARETGDPTYYQKAEGALQKALALQPEDYVAVSGMGALELARHRFLSALEWGERARQINPHRTYAYGVIADAQIELGRYAAAVETLQAMVDLRPDMSSYARIAYLRELYGDTEGALEMMQWAVDAGGPHGENTAWTRTQLANLYFNLGDLARAEVEYQRTLEGLPGYVYALAGMGRVRAAQGRTDEAIALLTQASEAMPLPELVAIVGDVYQSVGETEAARQQYDLVRVIQQLYQANGVDVDLELALFDADQGHDPAGTVARAREAYARRPNIHAADVLAWALYRAGAHQEAQTYAQQALRLGTQDALKLFHAGMIAHRLGERADASDYLGRALAINPYFSIRYADEARHALAELQTVSSAEGRRTR